MHQFTLHYSWKIQSTSCAKIDFMWVFSIMNYLENFHEYLAKYLNIFWFTVMQVVHP